MRVTVTFGPGVERAKAAAHRVYARRGGALGAMHAAVAFVCVAGTESIKRKLALRYAARVVRRGATVAVLIFAGAWVLQWFGPDWVHGLGGME